MYGYLADGVVLLHLAYIGYVVLGQLAIIIAAMFRWQWGRNRWFRATHLLAIGFVVFEYAIGMTLSTDNLGTGTALPTRGKPSRKVRSWAGSFTKSRSWATASTMRNR